ncbi:MAG: type III secretion chaperone [Chlamydiae bacterium CG10_big_fil_rev_8_21_14_0_10_35_9]|nr:MAG: type III secretion chaperone [Chlamydiae bacterium CG10_big_fil_rev_8_21_14_0_10_35_9]
MNWLELLGWNDEQLEDLRFVAYSYIKQGLYDTAITFFEALSVLSPENSYDLKTLGALYLQKGNSLEALNYLDRSLKIDPNDLQTQLNRAKALLSLGYKKQGISQAKKLQNSSNQDIAKQASALILAFPS